VLAEDHPDRLVSQHNLARAYQANGQVKDAVRLLEHVVAIQKRVLAENHPDRLSTQHNLALAYQTNGQVKDAVRLLEHVVAIRERVLAEDHPSRLASQHQLARAYEADRQLGRLESQRPSDIDVHGVASSSVVKLTAEVDEAMPHRSRKTEAYVHSRPSQGTGGKEGAGGITKFWQKLKKRI
jgi:tetratricopeptide (TPR) repeat protein